MAVTVASFIATALLTAIASMSQWLQQQPWLASSSGGGSDHNSINRDGNGYEMAVKYPHIQAGYLIFTCIQVSNRTYQVTIISFVPFPY
jgi:hypothetical protein